MGSRVRTIDSRVQCDLIDALCSLPSTPTRLSQEGFLVIIIPKYVTHTENRYFADQTSQAHFPLLRFRAFTGPSVTANAPCVSIVSAELQLASDVAATPGSTGPTGSEVEPRCDGSIVGCILWTLNSDY